MGSEMCIRDRSTLIPLPATTANYHYCPTNNNLSLSNSSRCSQSSQHHPRKGLAVGHAVISSQQQQLPGRTGLAGGNLSSQDIFGQAVSTINQSSQLLARYATTSACHAVCISASTHKDLNRTKTETIDPTRFSAPTGDNFNFRSIQHCIFIHLCKDRHYWACLLYTSPSPRDS